jgi:hypothetical protein
VLKGFTSRVRKARIRGFESHRRNPVEGTMRRIDYLGPFPVGAAVDIGWGLAVLHADDTLTRTCKGCGVATTTAVDRATGRVAEAAIGHHPACPMVLGNNAALS